MPGLGCPPVRVGPVRQVRVVCTTEERRHTRRCVCAVPAAAHRPGPAQKQGWSGGASHWEEETRRNKISRRGPTAVLLPQLGVLPPPVWQQRHAPLKLWGPVWWWLCRQRRRVASTGTFSPQTSTIHPPCIHSVLRRWCRAGKGSSQAGPMRPLFCGGSESSSERWFAGPAKHCSTRNSPPKSHAGSRNIDVLGASIRPVEEARVEEEGSFWLGAQLELAGGRAPCRAAASLCLARAASKFGCNALPVPARTRSNVARVGWMCCEPVSCPTTRHSSVFL